MYDFDLLQLKKRQFQVHLCVFITIILYLKFVISIYLACICSSAMTLCGNYAKLTHVQLIKVQDDGS